MKRFTARRLVSALVTAGLLGVSAQAMASGFQLFEQDAASLGNYHAGYASYANDASTNFYNPAGLTRIQNQQIIVGADPVLTSFKFNGSIYTKGTFSTTFNNVTDQGGRFNVVPFVHYATPINDTFAFGMSIVVPFGLDTSWGNDTPVRYIATLSSILVADFAPSVAMKVMPNASVGVGLDIEKMYAELDKYGSSGSANPALQFNSQSTNYANDTGVGFHFGGLYEINPCNRVGLSYHSQVRHHLSGYSQLEGPLAALNPLSANAATAALRSSNLKANVTLPAYTDLSYYLKYTPQIEVMASVMYTQWNVIQKLVLQNIAGRSTSNLPTTSGIATLPTNYKNTWNFSVGGNYILTPDIILRAGLGYDQTPVGDDRNLQLPDNDRIVVALGGHYQAWKTVGVDVGYNHFFVPNSNVYPPPNTVALSTTAVNGKVTGGADVFGAQVVWDIV